MHATGYVLTFGDGPFFGKPELVQNSSAVEVTPLFLPQLLRFLKNRAFFK